MNGTLVVPLVIVLSGLAFLCGMIVGPRLKALRMSHMAGMNRGYLGCAAVIIACLVISALGWLADLILPMQGWWILPKVIARDAKTISPFLAVFFAFGAALIWVGSKMMKPKERTDMPFWLMIGAAIFGKLGLLAMFIGSLVGFGYSHPLFFPTLIMIGVVVFGACAVAFFIQGRVREMMAAS